MLVHPYNSLGSLVLRSLLAAGVLGGTAAVGSAASLRCVVELFTSQGCSSCPPADALLAAIARQPDVLAMSFPVDYWDYIGWKDTLASPAFTARQKNYALTRGDGEVYTPQTVIDGLKHVVGSDAAEVESAIAESSRNPAALSVDIKLSEADGRLKVDLGPAVGDGPSTGVVWLMRIARTTTVQITHGENAGHSVTYTNVVRGLSKIGDWAGAAASFEIPVAVAKAGDADTYAVLLQAGTTVTPGVILAAAKAADVGL